MPASLLISQEEWIYNYRKCFGVAAGFAVKFELNSNDMVAARVAGIRLREIFKPLVPCCRDLESPLCTMNCKFIIGERLLFVKAVCVGMCKCLYTEGQR